MNDASDIRAHYEATHPGESEAGSVAAQYEEMIAGSLAGREVPDPFVRLLEQWFANELAQMHAQLPWPRRTIIMGFPVWGERYIDRCERWFVPSLLAQDNRIVLTGYGSLLVIYYAGRDFERMLGISRTLEDAGITVVLRQIPEDVMAFTDISDVNKNYILGVVQKLLIQMAARTGSGFHHAQPDHCYGSDFFPGLLMLSVKHGSICQSGLSADERTFGPAIESWRRGGAIEIDERALGGLAFAHLHPQMRTQIMNRRNLTDSLPMATWLIWIARDHLVLQRPHMNATWLSPEACRRAPLRIPNTIDAELPWFMPQPFHVPDIGDGLGYVEVSGPEKPHAMGMLMFREFALNYWSTVDWRNDHMPWLEALCRVPIGPQDEGAFMSEDEIARQTQAIPRMLLEAKAQARIDAQEIGLVER